MNQLVVTLIIMLIPGILAAVIADKIAVHSRWDSFKFGLYSVVMGFAAYASVQMLVWARALLVGLICWTPPHLSYLHIWSAVLSDGNGISAIEIVAAVVMALPLAFFCAWVVNFKLMNKIARRLSVSMKYGDENLYSYYLNTKEVIWVYVRDINANLTYQGMVFSHSENRDMQELVLTDVTVYRYDDSAYLYDVPTVYLSRPLGVLTIEQTPPEFLKGEEA